MSQNSDQPTLEQLRQDIEELKKLGENPAYQRVILALEGQLRARRLEMFNTQIKSLNGAFKSSYRSGEIAGVQLGLTMRELLIEDLRADYLRILELERNEEDGNNSTGAS